MKIRALALNSAASLAVMVGGAIAADLPLRSPAPPPAPAPIYAPIFTWTGLYVGVNAGYAGDKFEYPYGGEISGTGYSGKPSISSSGALFGAQVGYNWQFGSNWVVGIEADYQWSNIEGNVNINGAIAGLGTANLTAGSEINGFGTVRGRVGYGWDRALIYVTGGWAFGRVDSRASLELCGAGGGGCFGGGLSRGTTHNGWTAGVGMEYALTNNLSFKTEYLFVDLGRKNLYSANYGRGTTAALDVETRFHVVRAGLNYRFNWGGSAPVVAAY
jgi:outer membrane immunogenic protein